MLSLINIPTVGIAANSTTYDYFVSGTKRPNTDWKRVRIQKANYPAPPKIDPAQLRLLLLNQNILRQELVALQRVAPLPKAYRSQPQLKQQTQKAKS